MNADFKIGDICYTIEDLKVVKATIVGIKACNDSETKYDYKIEEKDSECRMESDKYKLFKTELEAETLLQLAIQNSNIKVDDLVICEGKLCYVIEQYYDGETKSLKFNLNKIYENRYNTVSVWNKAENELTKINAKHVSGIVKYKLLIDEAERLNEELGRNRGEIEELIERTSKEISKKFNVYNSWSYRFFKTEEYKKAKILFEREND